MAGSSTLSETTDRRAQWLAGFRDYAVYFVAALILWASVLNAFFLFDDISTLSIGTPLGGVEYWECWTPMPNGFWRPLPLSIAWLLIELFGASPLAFHLPSVAVHALNALLLSRILNGLGWSRIASLLTGGLFLLHFGSFGAVLSVQTLMDLLMTTGFLFGMLVVQKGLNWRRFPWLVGAFLLAAMSKETAVVFPVVMLCWWAVSRARHREDSSIVPVFATLFAVAAIIAVWALYMQATTEASYVSHGRVVPGLKSIFRQMCDYLFSGFFPYIHVVQLPVASLELPHSLLWLLRFATAGGCAVAVVYGWRRREWMPAGLLVCAAVVVAPASLLSSPPEARFLYPALPFLSILIAWMVRSSSCAFRPAAWAGAVLLSLLFVVSFHTSPTVHGYRTMARDVELLVEDLKRISPEWEPGCEISIINHPHDTGNPDHWAYCQQLFDLFIPDARATLRLGPPGPETCHAYRFVQGRLQPIETSGSMP